MYSNEAERVTKVSYGAFKLNKAPFGLYNLRHNISVLQRLNSLA